MKSDTTREGDTLPCPQSEEAQASYFGYLAVCCSPRPKYRLWIVGVVGYML